MELIDPTKFSVDFPLWMLVIDPEETDDGELILTRETKVLSGGDDALCLFTDDDLAERYALACGVVAQPIAIDTPQAAVEIATRLAGFHGLRYVAFDVSPSLGRTRVPAMPTVNSFVSFCEPLG